MSLSTYMRCHGRPTEEGLIDAELMMKQRAFAKVQIILDTTLEDRKDCVTIGTVLD